LTNLDIIKPVGFRTIFKIVLHIFYPPLSRKLGQPVAYNWLIRYKGYRGHHTQAVLLKCVSMKSIANIGLSEVQAVYSGPEGDLWELVMGQQIHIGGFQSSMTWPKRPASVRARPAVDLCCCNGAGMRFLVRFRNVARMTGVNATQTVVERGRGRCKAKNLPIGSRLSWPTPATPPARCKSRFCLGRRRLVLRGRQEATYRRSGPAGQAGRHYCLYRLGRRPLAADRRRIATIFEIHEVSKHPGHGSYASLLAKNGCDVLVAEDTGRFAPCVDLYLNMLNI